jgi:hypothetical protein
MYIHTYIHTCYVLIRPPIPYITSSRCRRLHKFCPVEICFTRKGAQGPPIRLYVYIDMYIYICIYIHMYMYTYVYIHMCVYICTYIYIHTPVWSCQQDLVFRYVCVCTYVYIYICICTHSYIHTPVWSCQQDLVFRYFQLAERLQCACIY